MIKKSQDVVTGQVCLEFKDEICADEPNYDNDPLGVGIGIDLKDWVWETQQLLPSQNYQRWRDIYCGYGTSVILMVRRYLPERWP